MNGSRRHIVLGLLGVVKSYTWLCSLSMRLSVSPFYTFISPVLGHPSFPLFPVSIYFLIFCFFLLFLFFHWLYLFSSFVHPFPFYQKSHSVSRPERKRPNLGLVCCVQFVLSVLFLLVKMDSGVLFYLV